MRLFNFIFLKFDNHNNIFTFVDKEINFAVIKSGVTLLVIFEICGVIFPGNSFIPLFIKW